MVENLKYRGQDDCYEYLSHDDSRLYASVMNSDDPKDCMIKSLLERIAASSRSAHRQAKY